MSGQPYRYSTDPEKYRAEYMEQLNTRAELDDTVLQAVKNYVNTGTIPPISQIPDTRTTSEKLLDIEKLKLGVIKDLEPIMSQDAAMAIIQGLTQSPLNSDNKLLIFFAQSGKALIDRLKEQYKYGIRGNANDIQTFVDFINNAYVRKQQGVNSVKQLIDGTIGGASMLTKSDIEILKNNIGNIRADLIALQRRPPLNNPFNHPMVPNLTANLNLAVNTLNQLAQVMPNDTGIKRLMEYVANANPPIPNAIEAVNSFRENFPKKGILETLYNQIIKFVKEGNYNSADEAVIKLSELIPDAQTQNLLNDPNLIQIYDTPSQSEQANRANQGVPAAQLAQGPIGHGIVRGLPEPARRRRGRPRGGNIAIPIQQRIEPEKGIKPSYQYTQFGKYLLSNPKLGEGILSIKTKSGANVIGLPSLKVSDNLTNIVKAIVGGKLPNYDDMNKLSEEEKQYLYKVSKKANILDKLNIPTPSKDKEEKDFHQFEVMKGEIMSGNDSKELIKNFKILLLRLSKSGKLPKNQVNEIFEELLNLGY